MISLVGTWVPYIIGVPSVKAYILGIIAGNYVLKQEYMTQDEGGKWIHVKKEIYRDKKFIDAYWCDTTG